MESDASHHLLPDGFPPGSEANGPPVADAVVLNSPIPGLIGKTFTNSAGFATIKWIWPECR